MVVSGAPTIVPKDITRIVRTLAKESAGVVHDLEKLPQQLLAGVVQSSLKVLGNLTFSFNKGNGQSTTASGTQLIEFLQGLNLPPAKIALTLHALATTHRQTPGPDNLIHIPVSKLLREIVNNDRLNNVFFAKAQKAIHSKKLDPFFKTERNPLDYLHITAQPRGHYDIAANKPGPQTTARKIKVISTGKLLALGKRLGLIGTEGAKLPDIKTALKELSLLQGAV